MSQHLNDPSSDAWGLPTTDVAVKGCDTAPGRLTQHLALTQQIYVGPKSNIKVA